MTTVLDRVAGAPITWGVCEVPGWGHQMAPERVLGEMAGVGLGATELGPEGFLPADPDRLRAALERWGLALVGGFVPVVLHERAAWEVELPRVERQADLLSRAGGSVLVIAAATGTDGYDASDLLDANAWRTLAEGLDRAIEAAEARGLVATLHPHFGTVIEGRDDVERLLERSRISLCLDTGHLAVAGADPVDVARSAGERVRHVHLKDVSIDVARRVGGGLGYQEAVRMGMYRPLGGGDLEVDAVIGTLERGGYTGWYVLEQDAVLEGEPSPTGGPREDVRTSYEYIGRVARRPDAPGDGTGERDAEARAGKEGP